MDTILWSEKYSVGIDKFDHQHKQIILLINKMFDSPEVKVNSNLISDTLTTMTQYSLSHFIEEEAYLKENGYDDFENHKNKHHEFLVKTMKLNQATMLCVNEVPGKLLNYLKEWWTFHILYEDMKYKDSFNDILAK